MAVFSNLHFHKSFQNQSLRLAVISYLSQERPYNFFHFVSKLSGLIFEGIQIFIEICTKFDRVREIGLEICCLYPHASLAQLIYGPEMSFLLWEQKVIPPTIFFPFLLHMLPVLGISTVVLSTDNSSWLVHYLFSALVW